MVVVSCWQRSTSFCPNRSLNWRAFEGVQRTLRVRGRWLRRYHRTILHALARARYSYLLFDTNSWIDTN